MASNLVQSSRARKILLAWRAQVADKKKDVLSNNTSVTSTNEGITDLEDADKDDAGDDVQLVIELLRKQHGQYSGKANERAKNIKQYLKDQITTMQSIYEVIDIDNSAKLEVNSETILKENNHPQVSLTIKECEMAITTLKEELKKI